MEVIDEACRTIRWPKPSGWACYLYGNRPWISDGLVWRPYKGRVPNVMVRFFMRICFDCYWERPKKKENKKK